MGRVAERMKAAPPNSIAIPIDTLIAGTAIAARATLVTRNIREFSKAEGLLVEDWY